jgi:hypothetical protein
VIDFTPKAAKRTIHLQELVKVFGYTYPEWTLILLYFRGLIIDSPESSYNKENFTIDFSQLKQHDPIFSFTYRRGSIKNGVLQGTWNSSGPSTANSALLWPEAYDFLISKSEEIRRARQTSSSAT